MAPGTAAVRSGSYKPILSSPQWQILLYLHTYYAAASIAVQLIIFIWKGQMLPYPKDQILSEVILLLLFGFVEASRIFWGMKGNLTERRMACFISISLSLTTIAGSLYFLLWQTYILRLEAIIIVISLVLLIFETIFGIVTFSNIQKSLVS